MRADFFFAMDLRPQIEKFSRRFGEVEAALSDPKAFDNPQRAQELGKEYARLKDLVAQGQAYLKTVAELVENPVPCTVNRNATLPAGTVAGESEVSEIGGSA